ncbi:MAG TPA: hypothetical protein EYP21_10250 [Syntrophaceae bacterium]|nr:hypothetical protein [Syntrophaceae bacterium]
MVIKYNLEELKSFKGGDFLVASLYLNVDGNKYPKKEYTISLKGLLKQSRKEIGRKTKSRQAKDAVEEDLRKIERFVLYDFQRANHKGLAVFSCSGNEFWQVYRLPRPICDTLIVDRDPYTRPLTTLLNECHKYCTILVDHKRARIFEVYLGNIKEHSFIFENVPSKVREARWYGPEERRIERHTDDLLRHHYKKVSEVTLDFFKRKLFDWLILGGSQKAIQELEDTLHPYLKEKIVDRVFMDLSLPVGEVLEKTLQIENKVERGYEERLVQQLMNQIGSSNLGVGGLSDTLFALSQGQVHILLVSDGFRAPGLVCEECKYMAIDIKNCPICGTKLTKVPDIIGEAICVAIAQNCQVRHISQNSELEKLGNTGAILRFKT